VPPRVDRRRHRRCADLTQPLNTLGPRPSPQCALSIAERRAVLGLLRAPRFADQAPAEVYASPLDEGVYLCSWQEAPALAWAGLQNERHLQHGRHLLPAQCAGCGNPIDGHKALDMPE
jgi:hypothetical protein